MKDKDNVVIFVYIIYLDEQAVILGNVNCGSYIQI
jgi:hypothetical protein